MKKFILVAALLITGVCWNPLQAQRACRSFAYRQNEIQKDAAISLKIETIENFTQKSIKENIPVLSKPGQSNIITIPVVVHILYHFPAEKLSVAQVLNQLEILNRDFRRQNADSVQTPARFKNIAADCEIEFKLATADPKSRATNGIVYKYSPISHWENNDNMKFSSQMGDDAWDSKSYLNIWVCNLDRLAGYSSFPGGSENKDGIVLDFGAFGQTGNGSYGLGRTAVHELGHWLNLNHVWGDINCGDDYVFDTPWQSNYTVGCPSTIRFSCNNAPLGDMFMNYMDFTDDACLNMFTAGQKARMRSLFVPGGARFFILSSAGLGIPQNSEIPLPDQSPRWLHYKVYPVPATEELNLDIAYDERWIGKTVSIQNLQGQVLQQVVIAAKTQKIKISNLLPGVYFISAKKEDGELIKAKFIKL